MITPDEYAEIARLPNDLAFLTLEAKYRLSLNQRHRRAEGEEDFDAIREYMNHAITAGKALGIEGSEFWNSNHSSSSSRQNVYDALDELITEIDRFAVVTRIQYARSSNAAAFQKDAFQQDTFQQDASVMAVEKVGLADSFGATLVDQNGNRLTVESPAPANIQLSTHENLQRGVDLLEAALLQWRPVNPSIGHNNPPGQLDPEIDRGDLEEIENLLELLKSQPPAGNLPAAQLSDEVAKASPLVEKLKSMGDNYLTELAKSAGKETGKLLSPAGAIAISIAYYLSDVIHLANQWIGTLAR